MKKIIFYFIYFIFLFSISNAQEMHFVKNDSAIIILRAKNKFHDEYGLIPYFLASKCIYEYTLSNDTGIVFSEMIIYDTIKIRHGEVYGTKVYFTKSKKQLFTIPFDLYIIANYLLINFRDDKYIFVRNKRKKYIFDLEYLENN